MAMASSGPTQSIAASLAAIMIAVAYAGFIPLVICFVPMIGIAVGYHRLNAWQPSAGATYSWVGRVVNPHAGFFAGWIMLMYYTIGTVSLTPLLGSYLLSFFSNAAANNVYDTALVGTILDLLVLVVAVLGVKVSARFQWRRRNRPHLLGAPEELGADPDVVVYLEWRWWHSCDDRRHSHRDLPLLGMGYRCVCR
jgi:amino acid transporter